MNSILSFIISLLSFLVLTSVGNATTTKSFSDVRNNICKCETCVTKTGDELCKNAACPNCKCGDKCKCGSACKCNAAQNTNVLGTVGVIGLAHSSSCKASCPNCKCGDNCQCGESCKCCKSSSACSASQSSMTSVAYTTTKAPKRKAKKSCDSTQSTCCKAS